VLRAHLSWDCEHTPPDIRQRASKLLGAVRASHVYCHRQLRSPQFPPPTRARLSDVTSHTLLLPVAMEKLERIDLAAAHFVAAGDIAVAAALVDMPPTTFQRRFKQLLERHLEQPAAGSPSTAPEKGS
jgi:hypothetical protein